MNSYGHIINSKIIYNSYGHIINSYIK